jgi:hypothetical protein
MEVDEITVPSPDLPDGLSFGPVTVERGWEGAVDPRDELPVVLTPSCCEFGGIRWYAERYRARGVFTVVRDQIVFAPTVPVARERVAWWRRIGYRLLRRLTPRLQQSRQHITDRP